jgi:hypothetical protein
MRRVTDGGHDDLISEVSGLEDAWARCSEQERHAFIVKRIEAAMQRMTPADWAAYRAMDRHRRLEFLIERMPGT